MGMTNKDGDYISDSTIREFKDIHTHFNKELSTKMKNLVDVSARVVGQRTSALALAYSLIELLAKVVVTNQTIWDMEDFDKLVINALKNNIEDITIAMADDDGGKKVIAMIKAVKDGTLSEEGACVQLDQMTKELDNK